MLSKSSFSPIGKRVIVSRKQPDVGPLKISETLAKDAHPDIGEVLEVGQIGWWNKYVRGIRPGRRICFTRYSPVAIKDEEFEHIFVDLENILGVQS